MSCNRMSSSTPFVVARCLLAVMPACAFRTTRKSTLHQSMVDERGDASPHAFPFYGYRNNLISAMEFAYDRYYSVDYPSTPPKSILESDMDKKDKFTQKWRFDANLTKTCGIPRANHALANAVRKVVILPVIEKFYRDAGDSSFTITPQERFMVQLTITFEVTGRQSEHGFSDSRDLYHLYRKRSEEFLTKYVAI